MIFDWGEGKGDHDGGESCLEDSPFGRSEL